VGTVSIDVFVEDSSLNWSMDGEQVKEVLLNLGVNALQAMNGRGILAFRAHEKENSLVISVQDNGPGIGVDALPHIFKPFYTRRSDGTGLGLSICQQIIEAHGGRITTLTGPFEGTTFRIIFPCSPSSNGKSC
jgi:signal transduction histidine kinase